MKTISIYKFQETLEQNPQIDLIDVRTPAEFETYHIVGARLQPLDELDCASKLRSRGANDSPLYLLCESGNRARKAAEKFAASGFEHCVVIEGGTKAWADAGLPVVRGRQTISLERQVRIGAGALVLTGVALGTAVHPAFYGLSAFVGFGLMFAGITGWCGMGVLLAKMPWNARSSAAGLLRKGARPPSQTIA
jgi:rhodanese-related sulfurtransferase